MLSISLFCLASCSNKIYTSDQLPEEKFVIGKSGGFAGLMSQFILLENGQVFRESSTTEGTNEAFRLEKDEAKTIWKQMIELDLASTTCNEPGNMTYFISHFNKENEYKAVWGGPNQAPPDAIKKAYTDFMQLVLTHSVPKEKEPAPKLEETPAEADSLKVDPTDVPVLEEDQRPKAPPVLETPPNPDAPQPPTDKLDAPSPDGVEGQNKEPKAPKGLMIDPNEEE